SISSAPRSAPACRPSTPPASAHVSTPPTSPAGPPAKRNLRIRAAAAGLLPFQMKRATVSEYAGIDRPGRSPRVRGPADTAQEPLLVVPHPQAPAHRRSEIG